MFNRIDHVLEALDFLEEVWAVGGCVRDALWHTGEAHPEGDIDVATINTPDEVLALCSAEGLTAIATGLDHGTVTVLVPVGSGEPLPVEITTFRRDVSTDGRRATVAWADTIEEDLARRDFTINALAYDGERVVDPYGGQQDLHDHVLDTVGKPAERFAEDLLRVVRGARFAARFDLAESDQTYMALLDYGPLVTGSVSVERITAEFEKAFGQCDVPSRFLGALHEYGVLNKYLPEVAALFHVFQNPVYHAEGDAFAHTLDVVDRAPTNLRWHALFHDVGKHPTADWVWHDDVTQPSAYNQGDARFGYYTSHRHAEVGADMVPAICDRIRLPKALASEIEFFTRLHMRPLDLQPVLDRPRRFEKKRRHFQAEVYDWARRRGIPWTYTLSRLHQLCKADGEHRRAEGTWALFDPVPTSELEPAVTGSDLIRLGHKPGPEIGRVLKRLRKHQLSTGETDPEKLLKHAPLT